MVVLFAVPIEVAGFVLCGFQANCTDKFVIAVSLDVRFAVWFRAGFLVVAGRVARRAVLCLVRLLVRTDELKHST
jgi:hypothetical protein